MLASLSIQNIVLIDQVQLELDKGLGVLTGETGAGKSILLDSLALVLGQRADSSLLRQGADQASVVAAFDLPSSHPVWAVLQSQDIPAEAGDGLILRRTLGADGRSRAIINDTPATVGLLRQVGDLLVEIHGQHGQQGLMDAATHRSLLDAYGGYGKELSACRQAHAAWQDAARTLAEAEQKLAAAQRDEDFLRHAVDELQQLAPKAGEEIDLAEQRALMQQGEKLTEDLVAAQEELSRDSGVDGALRGVMRRLERLNDKSHGALAGLVAAFDRAIVETDEALAQLNTALQQMNFDPATLEQTEERLFALRAASRKYDVPVEGLPTLRQDMEQQIAALDTGVAHLEDLRKQTVKTSMAFEAAVSALSALRKKAAGRLSQAVCAELPPLKLESARFEVVLEALPREQWTSEGGERVRFLVITNPGQPLAPLTKIASGGELSRFALAIKVALASAGSAPTLIFDEIDQGVGGAVAAAVGDRLAQLGQTVQVLVVTHAPQVAARGSWHLRVGKQASKKGAETRVDQLSGSERREEIARMLAGQQVTEEARAAADRLLQGAV